MVNDAFDFRIGAYGIKTIPGNVVLGVLTLVGTGKYIGQERMKSDNRVFYGNWTTALRGLYDKLLDDKVAKNNAKVVKGLMDAQAEAYAMIDEHLKRIKVLPAKESI